MNLQMLAIQTFMKSGGTYDDKEPILKNIIFDIETMAHDMDEDIRILKKRVTNGRRNLYKMSEFNTIRIPDTSRYDQMVDRISNLLFDDMSYERINTLDQIKWKEYFHGLYDMVVFPYQNDRTHHIQMINELYKYFNVLEPPSKQLEPGDPLYIDVRLCQDLFKQLKIEHKKMLIPKMFKKMKKNVENQINRRLEHKTMEIKLRVLLKLRLDCVEILRWSTS
jgi:hypothetical protein